MIARGLSALRNKRVLLLQGPVGPFFRRLAKDLTLAGAKVFKVNFNGGDWAFYSGDAFNFRGSIEEWPAFVNELISLHDIETVMLFGDCRIYHTLAYDVARKRGVEVGVFEEGYFRPDYVTLEREGVNAHSTLPYNPIFYLNNVAPRSIRTDKVGNTFWYAAIWAILYYLAAIAARPWFPKYRHHRPINLPEGAFWLRSVWRKAFYRVKEAGVQDRLVGSLSKKFFLVPLQLQNDAQLVTHSDFDSVESFLQYVVTSFAEQAPGDTVLVVKHHPLDRGYCDYTRVLAQLRREFRLGKRLVYIHDLHLPSLLDHARGVVVVNSTVGLSALYHKAPVKACGEAIYDIHGLTFQDSLDSFWTEARHTVVNADLYSRFRGYVIEKTQLNGSFYKRMSIPGSHTGLRWEERWLENVDGVRHSQPAMEVVVEVADGAQDAQAIASQSAVETR